MIEDYYKPGIVVQKAEISLDGKGGAVEVWNNLLTISGHIRVLSGGEKTASSKKNTYSTYRLYCAPAGITADCRILDEDSIYSITFIAEKKDSLNEVHHLEIDLLKVD